MKANKILFTGIVVDNEDPFLLNRIRVFPDSDEDILKVLKSEFSEEELESTNFGLDVEPTQKYSKRDPFVFYPLISFSLSVIPKVGEMVWVTYSNPKNNNGRKEQFYVPTMNSNPFNLQTDSYEQQKTNTSAGFNLTSSQKFKSDRISQSDGKKPYIVPIKGLFAEPGDNAFYGQGTTDLILKKNEVLLRAGKISSLQPNSINVANEQRGFLQLSYFLNEKIIKESTIVQISETDNTPLKKLIEYNIINLENTQNSFTGAIRIFDLPTDPNLQNDKFTPDTPIPNSVSTPVWSYQFQSLTLEQISTIINDIINGMNEEGVNLKTKYPEDERILALYNIIKNWSDGRIFPFYYRPDITIRKFLSLPTDLVSDPSSLIKLINSQTLTQKIKFAFAIGDIDGSGLVSRKNKFGTSSKTSSKEQSNSEYISSNNSVGILSSSKVFLLSNGTGPIPGKKPVNLKKETIYGLSSTDIFDNVLLNTDPLVRGEQLKQLLNLIVKFLTTHCHAFHGIPPVPVSFSSVSVAEIESELQLYDSKVLNQNIRIN